MNTSRQLVARAVFAGQLPASALTAAEIAELELEMMEVIIERKLSEGMAIVRADHVLH